MLRATPLLLPRPILRGLAVACCLLALAPGTVAQSDEGTLPSPMASEAPSLRFEHLGLADGLAQRSVNAIMQDEQGFLWFTTQGGLHRYDGREMKVYAPEPFDTTSLSAGYIWGIAESRSGDLWVATDRGGLNRLDPATGRATRYRHDADDPASLATDRLFDVVEDSEGDVWVATDGAGVARMRAGEEGRFEHLRHDPADSTTLSSDMVEFVTEGPEGAIWASTVNGLSRINPETGEVTRFLNDPDVTPTAAGAQTVRSPFFPPEATGIAWLATANGLVRLDTQTGEHERFLVEPNEDGTVNPVNDLWQITPDPHDPAVLWGAGTGAGLVRFDTRSETFTTYRHDPQDPNSLSGDFATALYADRSGTMWVGTHSAGLNAFNPKSANFMHLRHDPREAQSLAPGHVWGIHEDDSGALWVSTEETRGLSHLTQFDARTGHVVHYQHEAGDPATIQPGHPFAMVEDPEGYVWVGHFLPGGGLSRIDPKTGRVRRYEHERTPANTRRNAIIALLPGRSDSAVLWVGSADGLDRFDTRTRQFERVPLNLEGEAENIFVLSLHEDAKGTLWAGTGGAGLLRVRDGEARVASAHDPQDTTTTSSNVISDIYEREGEPGVLWLATLGGGLNRFDKRTGEATHYLKKDGLADNTIYGILEDEGGTLWMSTNGGISNFDPETETFRNYGLDDGLIALEYNQNAAAAGASGVLYFGSTEGVTAFSPDKLSTNETPPQVALTSFKLFNEAVTPGPGSPLKQALAETERITLAHDQNEVAFEFVALHYGNPAKNQYAYRLEGYDKAWVPADADHRTASYTNLPPGDYRFHVKAANPDGVWNEAGASIGLLITPPWWRTGWAYALFAALLVLSVFGADRLQRRRLAKKEAERAKIREAELRAEAQERRREDAERLSEIGRAITSTLSTRAVIDTVYEHVNALMDAAVFSIGIYQPERNQLIFPATKENGETLPTFTNDLDDETRPAVWCFTRREPIIVGDYAKEYQNYVPQRAAPVEGEVTASMIYLPLVHQDKAVGVITTQSFTKDAYSDYHVSVLKTLANYAAIAIDNAAAYRQLNATVSELKTTQQQLVQQEKMASLGQLTAGIAHEIKNPLNFITNFAEVNEELAEELREALANGEDLALIIDDIAQNARVIKQHGRRADSIVRSMMAHARTGTGEREVVSLDALVDEHVELAYHGKRAQLPGFNATIEKDYGADVGTMEVVPQDIGRIVLNLVGNAFDAVHEYAAGQNGQYEPKVTVSTRRVGDEVELRVTDNGPGIPEDVREKIFEPFFTTKAAGSGTGLGLSMSYDIVTQGHGGTLEVEQAAGGGAAFVVRLPTSQSHASVAATYE